jgi:phenylacetic acid degradation operon negative regulatory protein
MCNTGEDERPLTARSVLASTLLGVDPPELPVGRLVATARLFGIAEGTARTALSRMATAGEVAVADGSYRLAGHLLARRARQAVSRHPDLRTWDGSWRAAVVLSTSRTAAERASLRRAMAGSRLAEWREGVWLRPDNLAVHVPDGAAGHVRWLRAEPEDDPAALAGSLWDLDAWATRAGDLRGRLTATSGALAAGDTDALAPGFVLSASVLRHLQADPLLPEELLPTRWPGAALRQEYDAWDAAWRTVLADWHRRQDAADASPTPPMG